MTLPVPDRLNLLDAQTLFDPQGPIQKRHAWFDPRPQQKQMAQAVELVLAHKKHLFVEAGTGVGKSLAYLLPAAVWAVQNKKRVVVSTHTRALQEQLIAKDLPRVKTILAELDLPFEYALLMGAENYLCVQRLHQAASEQLDLLSGEPDAAILQTLLDWRKTAPSGLRRELPCAVSNDVWRKINRDSDLCLGKRGPYWEECLFRKDFGRARHAQILVVNHSLFFSGSIVEGADAVIFDEAHNLPEVASQFLGLTLSSRGVERLLQELWNPTSRKGLVSRLKRPDGWTQTIQEAIADAGGAASHFFTRVREILRLDWHESESGEAPARRILKALEIEDDFAKALEAVAFQLNEAVAMSPNDEEEAEIKSHVIRCQTAGLRVREFLASEKPDLAWWAELSRSRGHVGVELNAAPLDVSTYFRESVLKTYPSVVMTSATLAVSDSFALIKSQLGAQMAEETLLASPFRYEEQAGLYVARDIPDPRADPAAFEEAVIERCQELLPLIPGGIFILFTSWRLLHRVADQLDLGDRPLFKQGSEPPSKLVASFQKHGRGVLMGTSTFWEGVDVPGAALSGVILTKLPFLSPESPYEEAKQEWLTRKGVDVFTDYLLPKAVVKFRQGFGRLVRSPTDHGLVAVLDSRLHTKPYGRQFLRSLPTCHPLPDLSSIAAFFQARAAGSQ